MSVTAHPGTDLDAGLEWLVDAFGCAPERLDELLDARRVHVRKLARAMSEGSEGSEGGAP